jgi:hypothetical protein
MVCHATVIGAGAVADGYAAFAAFGGVNVLVAGTHRADQLQRGHGVDFFRGQANAADGEHRAEGLAMGSDLGSAFGSSRRIANVVVFGDKGEVGRFEMVEDEQGGLHDFRT